MEHGTAGRSHAEGGSKVTQSPVPEPSYSECARTLVYLATTGMLSTHSQKHEGWPFGSLMPYGIDDRGRPSFFISTMAMHTQNLQADSRASLFITQPGWTGEPLAGARITLIGTTSKIPSQEIPQVRENYLARYQSAAMWMKYDDFSFYRLDVKDIYYVAGFGAMGWVTLAEYLAASPDPIADEAPRIIDHMNKDHSEALLLLCRLHTGTSPQEALMISVDRLGFRVRLRVDGQFHGVRLPFSQEVRNSEDARKAFVAMVKDARDRERLRT